MQKFLLHNTNMVVHQQCLMAQVIILILQHLILTLKASLLSKVGLDLLLMLVHSFVPHNQAPLLDFGYQLGPVHPQS